MRVKVRVAGLYEQLPSLLVTKEPKGLVLIVTELSGFTVIKQQVSKSGRVGYFYFRLGQDPAAESQKIQGYFAQRPELKHFRFNVRNQKPKVKVPAAAPIVKRPSKF